MPARGPATYRIDEELHLAFVQMTLRQARKKFVMIGGGVALAAILWLVGLEVLSIALVSGLFGGVLASVFWQFVILPRRTRKIYQESAFLQEEITITLSDDEFNFQQASGSARVAWNKTVKWDETPTLFAIFINRQMAYILPKSQLGDAVIDYARDRLVETGLSTPGKLRK